MRRTATSDPLELHGDSDTSWAVPGRSRDLNTSEVVAYANSAGSLINFLRCPPGAQGLDMVGRGQKRLLLLANLTLPFRRLRIVGWQGMFLAAEARLFFHPMPRSTVPALRDICRYGGHTGTAQMPRSSSPIQPKAPTAWPTAAR